MKVKIKSMQGETKEKLQERADLYARNYGGKVTTCGARWGGGFVAVIKSSVRKSG